MGYGKSKGPKGHICGYCGRPGAAVLSNPGAKIAVFIHIKCRNESARKASEAGIPEHLATAAAKQAGTM